MGVLPTVAGRRAFISWWKYTSRPDSFARQMKAENYFFAQGASLSLFKYVPRALACLSVLLRRRPQLVFVSNPPVFAPLTVWLYCRLFNAKYVLDSHTSAFDRTRWQRFAWLHAWLARRAIFESTTNDALQQRMLAKGVEAVVVSDIPFELPRTSYPVDRTAFTLAFICSFDVDEPIVEAFQAVAALPDVHLYVTGNAKRATPAVLAAKGPNITFTGFLSNEDYAGLLRSVDAILVLTTYDHTMQRGGSEAITVEKPLITSDFPFLRSVFHQGTVHVDNSPEGIRAAILRLRDEYGRFTVEIAALRLERDEKWRGVQADLESRIRRALGPSTQTTAADGDV